MHMCSRNKLKICTSSTCSQHSGDYFRFVFQTSVETKVNNSKYILVPLGDQLQVDCVYADFSKAFEKNKS